MANLDELRKSIDDISTEQAKLREKVDREMAKWKKAALKEATKLAKERLHRTVVVDGVFVTIQEMTVLSNEVRLACCEISTTHYKQRSIRYVEKPTDPLLNNPIVTEPLRGNVWEIIDSVDEALQGLFPDVKKAEKEKTKKEKNKK